MTDYILRLPEVCKRVGLGKTNLYNQIKEGRFPKPIRLSVRSSGWLESEIQQWINDRVAASRDEGAA